MELLIYGYPRSDRRDCEREPEHEVGVVGEPLGVGVSENNRERNRRQHESQAVEHVGREHEQRDHPGQEHGRFRARQFSGGDRALGRSRILRVDSRVDDPVE